MITQISFLLLVLVVCVWLYVLTYRQQRLQDHGEGTLDTADRILWSLQQRMATRGLVAWLGEPEPTVTPAHEEHDRRVLLARLHAALQVHAARVPLTAPPREPEPRPTPGPATVSDLKRAWEVAPPQLVAIHPEHDDVDHKLARFTYAEGHTR